MLSYYIKHSALYNANNNLCQSSHSLCAILQICALRVTDGARRRILKAGGKVMTFDQLAMASPKGQGTVLLSGPRKGREVYRHFGKAPGTPHSRSKYVYR
ncbi:large ribosomal subunit protein eL18 [Cynoglossus semilaevis]|uniref:large ribosomal subunit protein eL18 n=1 Tax=Cynoglossus semilaevis TaxID=244447 RepID=UPI0004950421|nr:60S ribosomal protein L18 [Cynoglossus semilaevis]